MSEQPLVSDISFCGVVPELCAPLSGPKLAALRVAQRGKQSQHQHQQPEAPKLRAATSDALSNRIWTADDSGALCLREAQSGAAVIQTAAASNDTGGAAANALLWVRSRNQIWGAFTTGNILVFDATTGTSIAVLKTGGDGAMCLTESRCGRYVFCGGVVGCVTAFSVDSIAKVGSWREHGDALVLSVASSCRSAEFGFIASGGSDGSVLLWEPEDEEEQENAFVGAAATAAAVRKPYTLSVVRNFTPTVETVGRDVMANEADGQDAAVLALLCIEVKPPPLPPAQKQQQHKKKNPNDSSISEINTSSNNNSNSNKRRTQQGRSPKHQQQQQQQQQRINSGYSRRPTTDLVSDDQVSTATDDEMTQSADADQQQHAVGDVTPFVWVGNAGGRVRVWNCATGQIAADMKLHDHSVSHLSTCASIESANAHTTSSPSPNAPRVWSAGLDGKVFGIDSRTFEVLCAIQQPSGVQCVVPVAAAMAWRLWACAVDGSARAYVYQVDDSRVGELLLDLSDNKKNMEDAEENSSAQQKQKEHKQQLMDAHREVLEAEQRTQYQAAQQQRIISELKEELMGLTSDYDKQMVSMQGEITRLRSELATEKATGFINRASANSPSKNGNSESAGPQLSLVSPPRRSTSNNNNSRVDNDEPFSNPQSPIINAKDAASNPLLRNSSSSSPVRVVQATMRMIDSEIVLAEIEDTELFSRLQLAALECDGREYLSLTLQSSIFAEVRRSMLSNTPLKQQQQSSSSSSSITLVSPNSTRVPSPATRRTTTTPTPTTTTTTAGGTPNKRTSSSSSSSSAAAFGVATAAATTEKEKEAALQFQRELDDLHLRLEDRDREAAALRELLEMEKKRAQREIAGLQLSLQQQLASDKQRFEQQLLEAERAARRHETALREAELQLTTLRAKEKGRSESMTGMNSRVDELEAQYAAALDREAAAHTRSEKLLSELDEARKQLAQRSGAVNSTLEANAALRERLDVAEGDLQRMADAAAEQEERAAAERAELEQRNERLQGDLLAMRGPWESMKAALRESHASLEALKGEFESLERDMAFERNENEKLRMHLQQRGAGGGGGGSSSNSSIMMMMAEHPQQQQQQQQQQLQPQYRQSSSGGVGSGAAGGGGGSSSRGASPSVPRSALISGAVPMMQHQQQQQQRPSGSQFNMMMQDEISHNISGSSRSASSSLLQQQYAPGALPRALDAVIERFSSLPR